MNPPTMTSRTRRTITPLLRWMRSAALSLTLGLVGAARADALLVGGTGSAEPLLKPLFAEFNRQSPDVACAAVSPPLGSGGAVRALSSGKIDLAIVARPLKAQEEAGFGRHFELGATPFVMATFGGQRPGGFTLDQLAAVYAGTLQTWEQGHPIRLVLRTRDDSDTEQLRSMSAAMDHAVRIADQRPGMVYGNDDLDTLELLERTPGSLGPTTLGLLRTTGSRLSVLPLNAVAPSLANLRNGSYPWRKTLTVVLPLKPSPAAEKFAAFLRSSQAAELMRRNDYWPARR